MSIARSAALLVLVGVGVAPLTGCESLVTPCYSRLYSQSPYGFGDDRYNPPPDAVYGNWTLTKVSSLPVPDTGVTIPGAKGQKFISGSLRFITEDYYFADDCGKLLRERGVVQAVYKTRKPGELIKEAEYWGKFVADHESNSLTLRASDKSGKGKFSDTGFDITVTFPTDFIDVGVQFHFDKGFR